VNLEQYIQVKYGNKVDWFIDEVTTFENEQRILDTIAIREYLSGKHDILKRPTYKYNGQEITPRRIVINMAKTIVNFKTQYLLKNPVTLIGDKELVDRLNKVNKLGRFDDKNEKILSRLLKYGQVYEYLYINNKGQIDSKLINADEGTPIFNRNNELIAFIEHYVFDGISYWIVYTEDYVQEWTNEGGEVYLSNTYVNVTGLPIVYMSEDETTSIQGRSDLTDYVNILDNMEDVISKYVDSMYKFMNPIPVAIGQQLKDTLPSEVVGGGINLDDGADFKMVTNELDSKSFELVYKTLNQTLLDVSSTPAVSMNKTDISNLSEVSIKLLFSLADTSAGVYENYLINGFFERYYKIIKLLNLRGANITDEQLVSLDFKFIYNTPSNNKEILDNMKTQFDMGAISRETIIENSPYIKDSVLELKRIDGEVVQDDTN